MQAIQDYYIAPGAVVRGDVVLSPGVNIWFGAVVRGDIARIVLAPRVNIQDGSIVHTDHDTPQLIDEGVVVGHAAVHALSRARPVGCSPVLSPSSRNSMSEAAESIVPQPQPPTVQFVDPVADRRADVDAKQISIAELLQESGRECVLLLEPENVS